MQTFRATGITAYLKNGGKLEVAQQMAAHESARTAGLYDRRGDEISLDEVERIVILLKLRGARNSLRFAPDRGILWQQRTDYWQGFVPHFWHDEPIFKAAA
jgi:hypothetical protein